MSTKATPARPSFPPADPDFERAVRSSFARQGLMGTIGAWLVDVEPGRVTIEVPFSGRIAQQQDLFHGGVIGAIADSAGGCAALSLLATGSTVVTVEYKITFMRPASGHLLRAVGQVVRAGKSVTVTRTEIECLEGQSASMCALVQATMVRTANSAST